MSFGLIIVSSSCLLSSPYQLVSLYFTIIIFFFIHFFCFYHYLLCFISSFHLDWWFLHILVHREGSHITPFIPSLELIQRSWLKRLSHGCEFTCSLVIEFIPCIFPIGVWIIDDQSMHIHSKKRKEKWKKKWK